MARIINFPGTGAPEPKSSLAIAYVGGDQVVNESGELLGFTVEDAKLANAAIDGLTAHFSGAQLDLSRDSRRSRAALVAEYSLDQVVKMMGQSNKEDWMRHPAFYGALAWRFLTDVLGGEDPDYEDDAAANKTKVPPTNLRLLKPDDSE